MIKWIFNKVKKSRAQEMRAAIFWKDGDKVRKLLDKGVDPNGWSGDQTYLGAAVFRNAEVIARMLIEAGGDPLEPYYLVGVEYRLSEAARMFDLSSSFIDMLAAAEADAELKSGPRPLKNFNSCSIRPSP